MTLRLHDNGAVVDDDGVILVRFVYAEPALRQHLLRAVQQYVDARPAAAGCRIDPKGPKPAEPDARGDDSTGVL